MGRGRVALCVVAALALVPACGDDDDGPAAQVGSAQSTERTTTTLTPEAEVEAAYLRSWDVYAEAVLELDPTGLEESYRGRALEIAQEDVEKLKSAGTPVRTDVEHNYEIRMLQPDLAEVEDAYRNHSVLLDAESGEPIEADPNEIVTDLYVMQKLEGRWLVLTIERL